MEVDLPPDVQSGEESSDVELPPLVTDTETDDDDERCNCKLRCHKNRKIDAEALRANQLALPTPEQRSKLCLRKSNSMYCIQVVKLSEGHAGHCRASLCVVVSSSGAML